MGEVMYDAVMDPQFQDPYIDRDEEKTRTLPDGGAIPFRYIHGGFRQKKVKFSCCFPAKETYQGRFFQYLSPFPGPDEEMASFGKHGTDDKIAFALSNGAYFVESNMGSEVVFGAKPEPTLVWKASAAAAEYSRVIAREVYTGDGSNLTEADLGVARITGHGEEVAAGKALFSRPYGFVYGGSGGGYKTMACIENTQTWDGAAPFVIGSPASLPNTIMLHAQGQRTLRHVFGKIVDSLDAGGSQDMYEGLNEDEQKMLREITLMGFPPQSWFMEAGGTINDGALPVLMPIVKMQDASYFTDFWTKPGYLGADPDGNAVRDRLVFRTHVVAVHGKDKDDSMAGQGADTEDAEDTSVDSRNGVDDAWKKMLTDGNGCWIEVDELPEGDDLYLDGVAITPQAGPAKGKQLLLDKMVRKGSHGGYLTIGMCFGMDDLPGVLGNIKPGDELLLDNSDYIAVQSYYRHQVPKDLNYHAWDQFRNADGTPKIPQREKFLGMNMTGTGTVQDGNIQGKVIVTQSLMDESTCPWCGAWYRDTVRSRKGNEDDFRIYYMQRCLHNDDSGMDNNMIIDYQGALRQAILDLADWVQYGKEPLPTTRYKQDGGRIYVTERGAKRGGMQAQVILTANGEKCAHVKAGEPVTLKAYVEVPEGAGEVTSVYYDFKDVWTLPDPDAYPVEGAFKRFAGSDQDGTDDHTPIHGAASTITHTWDQPGTYFASVRITTNRTGDPKAAFTQVKNLDRVRIIVE